MWGATASSDRQAGAYGHFNPRSPCGERHPPMPRMLRWALFQSTLPVWGATGAGIRQRAGGRISIHAPRVGSDNHELLPVGALENFNPRSPCGERRSIVFGYLAFSRFQSTLPVWGATSLPPTKERQHGNFNPRSPCGERRLYNAPLNTRYAFQSTLPVWGATYTMMDNLGVAIFQSTLPVWGATAAAARLSAAGQDFNPRSPCGERQ